jgi:hypothetical protein
VLGILNAIEYASARSPVPRSAAILLSRMYPKILLTMVNALIVDVDLSTLRCSLMNGKVYHWTRTHPGGAL